MKYYIASDIHGDSACCKKFLDIYEKEQGDMILLLGDLFYHGPRNGLPDNYDVVSVSDELNKHAKEIICVRGNCDADVDQKMADFPIEAEYLLLREEGITYFLTHGHIYNTGHLPPMMGVDVLLHGHTHVPACEKHDGYYYLNPGSTSIPKGGSKNSFMVLEGKHLEWRHLEDNQVYASLDL